MLLSWEKPKLKKTKAKNPTGIVGFTLLPVLRITIYSTLLSPPDTARMFPVMDQLTCQTTSLNLWSSLAVQVLPAGSSHVQINTRPSWKRDAEATAKVCHQEGHCLVLLTNVFRLLWKKLKLLPHYFSCFIKQTNNKKRTNKDWCNLFMFQPVWTWLV